MKIDSDEAGQLAGKLEESVKDLLSTTKLTDDEAKQITDIMWRTFNAAIFPFGVFEEPDESPEQCVVGCKVVKSTYTIARIALYGNEKLPVTREGQAKGMVIRDIAYASANAATEKIKELTEEGKLPFTDTQE